VHAFEIIRPLSSVQTDPRRILSALKRLSKIKDGMNYAKPDVPELLVLCVGNIYCMQQMRGL
jgi:hypothetical protein